MIFINKRVFISNLIFPYKNYITKHINIFYKSQKYTKPKNGIGYLKFKYTISSEHYKREPRPIPSTLEGKKTHIGIRRWVWAHW